MDQESKDRELEGLKILSAAFSQQPPPCLWLTCENDDQRRKFLRDQRFWMALSDRALYFKDTDFPYTGNKWEAIEEDILRHLHLYDLICLGWYDINQYAEQLSIKLPDNPKSLLRSIITADAIFKFVQCKALYAEHSPRRLWDAGNKLKKLIKRVEEKGLTGILEAEGRKINAMLHFHEIVMPFMGAWPYFIMEACQNSYELKPVIENYKIAHQNIERLFQKAIHPPRDSTRKQKGYKIVKGKREPLT